jgi:hypothetical protein
MAEQKFPDGFDRTINDPCVLLSAASVRRLYIDAHGAEKDGYPPITDDNLKRFIEEKSKEMNWGSFEFKGGQVLLTLNLQLHKPQL